MKASELRIGNFIHREDIGDGHLRTETVLEINADRLMSSGPAKVACRYQDIYPIPLTEQWLIKFGGHADPDYSVTEFEVYVLESIYLLKKANQFAHCIYGCLLDMNLTFSGFDKIEYVHQLQNLYFSLTGQELEIKP